MPGIFPRRSVRPFPPALDAAGAQTPGQFATQLTAALDEERLIDGLVAHPHHRIVWKLEAQPAGDLLGRPPLLEPLGDLVGQRALDELGGLRAPGPVLGALMGPPRPIAAASMFAADLSRDGRDGSTDGPRDHREALVALETGPDFLPLAHGQMPR